MPEKKEKEVPLPTKFLVLTHVQGNGESVKFIFQPVGTDGVSIPLPPSTPAIAFEASTIAVHLQTDRSDPTGLTVIGRPLIPVPEGDINGLTIHGQTTLPDSNAVVEGTSEPINLAYGPVGPMGHRFVKPEAKKSAQADVDKPSA